ncbi:hypothetical protein As57867_007088, partial [Aphanomyces stellatus]
MEHMDARLVDELDKRLKKRVYIRTFMKTYRKKEKKSYELLKAHKVQLELEVRQLILSTGKYVASKTMLPWKDIAAALATHKQEAIDLNRTLQGHLAAYSELLQDMQEWVCANVDTRSSDMLTSALPTTESWRSVFLPRNPAARTLAKEWITQQLYVQTEARFQSHAFPPQDHLELYHHWDMSFTDECFHVTQCTQFVWDVSVDTVVKLYRDHLCAALWLNGYYVSMDSTVRQNLLNHPGRAMKGLR